MRTVATLAGLAIAAAVVLTAADPAEAGGVVFWGDRAPVHFRHPDARYHLPGIGFGHHVDWRPRSYATVVYGPAYYVPAYYPAYYVPTYTTVYVPSVYCYSAPVCYVPARVITTAPCWYPSHSFSFSIRW